MISAKSHDMESPDTISQAPQVDRAAADDNSFKYVFKSILEFKNV